MKTNHNSEALTGLLNEHDVARLLGLSVSSVRRRRILQQPPRFLKIGASVRYQPEDIHKFLESCPSGGTPQGEVAQ